MSLCFYSSYKFGCKTTRVAFEDLERMEEGGVGSRGRKPTIDFSTASFSALIQPRGVAFDVALSGF